MPPFKAGDIFACGFESNSFPYYSHPCSVRTFNCTAQDIPTLIVFQRNAVNRFTFVQR